MNLSVFIGALFSLLLICLVVGRRASKQLSSNDDYFLAGRSIRFFPLMMTLVATQVGGGLVLGSAEEAYKYGWSVLLYPLGASLGFLLLAAGIGRRMAQFPASTVAQLFEIVYRSTTLKKFASLLSIVSLFMILVAQVIASKKFMLSLGVNQEWIFLGFWAIVMIYTVLGGLQGVVATDIIQAAFFMGIFFLSMGYTLLISSPSTWSLVTAPSMEGFEFDPSKLCGWLLMPLFFMVIEQDMGQRCFAAKSGKVVSWASGVAALCTMLVCIIPVSYGVLAKTSGMAVAPGSSILMAVVEVATTPVLAALMGCAILVAIISASASLINAISSNVMQDFGLTGTRVKSSQLVTCAISLFAIVWSYSFNNVVDLLILSYELSVSCLFVPVFAALFIREGNKLAAIYAIVLGAAGFIAFRIVPLEVFPKELASLGCSLIGYGLGSLQSRYSVKEVTT